MYTFYLLSPLSESSSWSTYPLTHDIQHNHILAMNFSPWSLFFSIVLHVVAGNIASSHTYVSALISLSISLRKYNEAQHLIILFLNIFLMCQLLPFSIVSFQVQTNIFSHLVSLKSSTTSLPTSLASSNSFLIEQPTGCF